MNARFPDDAQPARPSAEMDEGREPADRMARPTAPCPVCGKPSLPQYRSFCSARCADVDLGRWLSGNYRVETEDPSDADPLDPRGGQPIVT